MERDICFALNGESVRLKVEEGRVLRSDLGPTGTKFGCCASLCGASTVIADDEAIRSCTVPLAILLESTS